MLFEKIATGGCQSYLVGCKDKCVAALIDPEISQLVSSTKQSPPFMPRRLTTTSRRRLFTTKENHDEQEQG